MNGPLCTNGLKLDAPIYRIHPQRHLADLLAGRLLIPATRRWDDPYENLISWCCFVEIGSDKTLKQTFFANDRFPTFGRCWSTIPESDAMWRIYSNVDKNRALDSSFSHNEGVRLRTTARKLLDALAKGMGAGNESKCFIGSVSYMEEAELQSRIADAVSTNRENAFGGIKVHADDLLLKRTQFAHEHEVRLLDIDSDRKFERGDFIEVPIDANSLIDEIMLDPRLRAGGGGEPKRIEWLHENGFKNTVRASSLYQKVIFEIPLYKPEDLRTN